MVMRVLKKEIWPYMITLNTEKSDPEFWLIENWIKDNIGQMFMNWCILHRSRSTDFYFKNPADATAFVLRWK
jgi:hypothetical protein